MWSVWWFLPVKSIITNHQKKSFDDSLEGIIQTFDWWLVIKKGFGLLIGLWLAFLRRNDENWAGGPPWSYGWGQDSKPCFARPKWPTCSCNTTISLTRWEDLQQLCGKPMEKNKRNARSKGQPWKTLKIWGKTIGKTWLVIIIPHCMAMYTTAYPMDSDIPWHAQMILGSDREPHQLLVNFKYVHLHVEDL